jgi:hypothetical protein
VGFAHFPPLDTVAADRLRAVTIAWSELLGELSAVGLRPYLELEQGDANDALRLCCELDDALLVDLSIDDEAFPELRPKPRARVTAIGSCSSRNTTGGTALRSRSRATFRSRSWRAV